MTMLDSLATETTTDAAVLRAVERAMAELRRGEPVLLSDAEGAAALILAAEQAGDESLARLDGLSEGGIHLVLTGRRAHALGLDHANRDPASRDPTSREPGATYKTTNYLYALYAPGSAWIKRSGRR